MLMGDPTMRSRPDTKLKRQNCYRCYTGPNFGGDTSAPCQDAKFVLFSPCVFCERLLTRNRIDTEALPPKPCLGGIRSNILFPT